MKRKALGTAKCSLISSVPCQLLEAELARATYLHRLQHLLIRDLCLGRLAACRTERSLNYFASVSFKLLIKEESKGCLVFAFNSLAFAWIHRDYTVRLGQSTSE